MNIRNNFIYHIHEGILQIFSPNSQCQTNSLYQLTHLRLGKCEQNQSSLQMPILWHHSHCIRPLNCPNIDHNPCEYASYPSEEKK